MSSVKPFPIPLTSPEAFHNRELSWLAFASRVIALTEDPLVPLLERVKFVGIAGMLHDEFFMKRVSGLKRQMQKGSTKLSLDGRQPAEEFEACREEIVSQTVRLARVLDDELRPRLADAGLPLLDYTDLGRQPRE